MTWYAAFGILAFCLFCLALLYIWESHYRRHDRAAEKFWDEILGDEGGNDEPPNQ
jgi:hypothetical protein